ncbi:Translocon-associated protein beta (TRAPB) [uncultured archaeon]|nr:Translocon-associated protein beta (TRAPB) [uncultured archaeon]
MRQLIYLVLLIMLLVPAQASSSKSSNDDETTYTDFTLGIGDRVEVGEYRAELIEIQSVRDGLAVMRISKVGGALDEQRALLQNSANNFDGGAEGDGITITVTDILDDQTAKVRLEYKEGLGTAHRRTAEKSATVLDKPNLLVQKSFDKSQVSVGDEVKVTVFVKNTGSGQAMNINPEDMPPLPEFSYIAGYPPKIKDTLDPGESDSAIYVMSAVKEGSLRIPAIQVKYTDTKKNVRSNSSEPFNILIAPKNKADLRLKTTASGPIQINGQGKLNISLSNVGKASATRVEVSGDVKPSDGLQVTDLEKSFFEILPETEENYSANFVGTKAGNYIILLRVSYEGGDGAQIQEGKAEVVVLEQEYKYLYLLLIIPVIIIIAWIYRRYREYKY